MRRMVWKSVLGVTLSIALAMTSMPVSMAMAAEPGEEQVIEIAAEDAAAGEKSASAVTAEEASAETAEEAASAEASDKSEEASADTSEATTEDTAEEVVAEASEAATTTAAEEIEDETALAAEDTEATVDAEVEIADTSAAAEEIAADTEAIAEESTEAATEEATEGITDATTAPELESDTALTEEDPALKKDDPDKKKEIQAADAASNEKSGYCGMNEGTNVKWSFSDDGTLTLTGSGEMDEWNDDIFWGQDRRVPWYNYREQITKVVIGNGITYIGCWSFAHTKITSITFPSSVKKIGMGALAYCYDLKEVKLNEGLEEIGSSAFSEDSLDHLYIPSSVKEIDSSVFDDIGLSHIEFGAGSIYYVNNGAMYKDGGKTLVNAPKDQTGTFTVPASVEVIGPQAFYNAKYDKVILPSNLRAIKVDAFAYTSFESIELPGSLKEIGTNAFSNSSLKSITIPASVTDIDFYVFIDSTSLVRAVVNCKLESVSRGMFYRCESLKNVTLSDACTAIPEDTFTGCALTSIKLPSKLKEIGYMAFAYNTGLTQIEFSEGLETIGEAAFYETGLTKVTLPASVKSVGPNAFPENAQVITKGDLMQKDDGNFVSTDDYSQVELKVTYGQTEARKMLSMINNFRKAGNAWYYDENNKKVWPKDLESLQYDYELEKIAMQRAAEIAMTFSHDRPDGSSCFTAYPNDLYASGENIAYGIASAQDAFFMWQETNYGFNGQGHRRNMLSDSFNCVGIGHAVVGGAHYWVQVFGARQNINKKATTAVNSAKSVSMFTTNSLIDYLTLKASPASYLLNLKGSSVLPTLGTKSGSNLTIKKMFKPVWKSANSKIAKIDNGRVYGVAKGKTYIYCKAFDRTVKVTVVVGKLATPKLTSAVNGTKRITFKWKKVPGAVKYRVCRKTGKQSWKGIATTKSLYYVDKNVKNGVKYYYTVFAVMSDGKTRLSGYSKTGLNRIHLTRPTLAKVYSSGAGKIAVQWKKNSSCTGYVIQYATDKNYKKNAKMVVLNGKNKFRKTLTGLKKGKKYYVRIRTYRKVGSQKHVSAWSASKTVTVKK